MRVSDAFPSNYLKATDLQGRAVTVKIDRTEMEKIGDDRKLILYFIGKDKGMVLNKTNANNIAYIYGDDTDMWHGNEITLFEAMVDFQGKTVPAIRIRAPQKQHRQPESGRQPPQQAAELNDEVPF
jgi:hypothetical protein